MSDVGIWLVSISVGLSLAMSGEARAALRFDLVQVGGTYDGIAAQPGDTLVLEIRIGVPSGDTLKEADPTINFDPAGMTYDPSHSLQIGLMDCCTSVFDPQSFATFGQISILDGLEAPPGHVDAWGVRSLSIDGARGPGSFSPGRIAFVLTGVAGSIRTAGMGTYLLDSDGNDVTSSSHLGRFDVQGAIPEPSTAGLVSLGLFALGWRRR